MVMARVIIFDAIAVYVGRYSSIEEAKQAGAEEIKDRIWGKWKDNIGGYLADYSKGVWLTVSAKSDKRSQSYNRN